MTEEIEEKKPRPKKVKWAKYIGNGSHIIGIPGRDMTLEEWNALGKGLQEHLVHMGLYEVKYDKHS